MMLFSPKEKGQAFLYFAGFAGLIVAVALLCQGVYSLVVTGSFPKGW